MNESFWDAQGVEIEACTIFGRIEDLRTFDDIRKFDDLRKKEDPMLGVLGSDPRFGVPPPNFGIC